MKAQRLVTDLHAQGVKFELDGESFRIRAPRGLITPELRDELAERKPEILALLRQTDTEIKVSYLVGDCPHCRRPLEVRMHPLDDEVLINCPEGILIKVLKHDACEWCIDCADKLTVIAGRCADCIRRLMLASNKPCPDCNGVRFWRFRANKVQPAGFAW